MQKFYPVVVILICSVFVPLNSWSQSQNITFRYVPGDEAVARAFVPGEFNNWGPNDNGIIATNAASLMSYVDSLAQWIYSEPLQVGQTYQYKVHLHLNDSGTDGQWISDPLNPITNPADNNNSVIAITDPMAFQAAHEMNGAGLIAAVSAGLFGTEPVTDVQFWINGIERDGLPYYNAETGIFRYNLERPIKAGSQFKIKMTDQAGRSDSLEIGEILLPVSWNFPGFSTVKDEVTLSATITRLDGSIDSTLTQASLIAGAEGQRVDVSNGSVEVPVGLALGANTFVLEASVDGAIFRSDTLGIERKLHPLNAFIIEAATSTDGNSFTVNVTETALAPDDLNIDIRFDAINSTSTPEGLAITDDNVAGMAHARGELYFNITASLQDTIVDKIRVGIKVDEGGVREMQYEDTPAWVNNAVVYEIFPLSFGPEANGDEENPGEKLREITSNLAYVAEMGFNTIWFMPIMKNQFMDPISGGYNITDFYNVDPRLGTNEDFRDLVEHAHALGIKIILDITPNHASPIHPWVNALRNTGSTIPPGSYIQTEPSAHNRGLDNRGPNLSEIWQVSNGGNLYRKYEGFGDLANLNWDNDDLQAEFLDILAHWVNEYDIDGWRFDVYWGPWRRYGPERFGRPIRELMKRIKPDSWILGEIAGTGFTTEVYYADDDNGTAVVGGMDAGYDWNLFFNGFLGTYGNIGNYDNKIHNDNFWPGPNARFFRFLENHDEERIAKRLNANPLQILPLTGLLMTTTGVPMIYQGQEVNFGDVSGDERRVSVNWNTALNGQFGRYHQQLAQARRQFSAFGTQAITTLNTANNIYAFARPYNDENALVLINFAEEARTIEINPTSAMELTTDGPITYTHLFADSSFVDALDGFTVTLAPYETAIFIANGGEEVAFDLPALPALPFGAVYTSTEESAHGQKIELALEQNYPNPFSAKSIIPFTIPEAGHVELRAYDLLGREVRTLIDESRPAGHHKTLFDGTGLPVGVYFIRLEAAGQSVIKQMVLVR